MNNTTFVIIDKTKNHIMNLKTFISFLLSLSLLFVFSSCSPEKNASRNIQNKTQKSYSADYFSGKAEICSYELEKARYDSTHPGEAVLIFVAEPFLPQKQVKADDYSAQDYVQVLKMNRVDRFVTGIYDYSQFTSVFTPLYRYDPTFPLKITMSSQDWCGQSFMQLNNNKGFDVLLRSYFESEGDQNIHLDYAITEDNIFNLIRIDEKLLPIGSFEIIPSFAFKRSSHTKENVFKATAEIITDSGAMIYHYEILELNRSVEIVFDPKNENRITSWKESYPTVFDQEMRTSNYTLKKVQHVPYWEMNKAEDVIFRDSLGLWR